MITGPILGWGGAVVLALQAEQHGTGDGSPHAMGAMLGSALVLIAVPLALVLIAAAWYRRSQRATAESAANSLDSLAGSG